MQIAAISRVKRKRTTVSTPIVIVRVAAGKVEDNDSS